MRKKGLCFASVRERVPVSPNRNKTSEEAVAAICGVSSMNA